MTYSSVVGIIFRLSKLVYQIFLYQLSSAVIRFRFNSNSKYMHLYCERNLLLYGLLQIIGLYFTKKCSQNVQQRTLYSDIQTSRLLYTSSSIKFHINSCCEFRPFIKVNKVQPIRSLGESSNHCFSCLVQIRCTVKNEAEIC